MKRFDVVFEAMGGEIRLTLFTRHAAGLKFLRESQDEILSLERKLSRFEPTSELSMINSRLGEWVSASPSTIQNIAAARMASEMTSNIFNPVVLDRLVEWGYRNTLCNEHINPPQLGHIMQNGSGIEIDFARSEVKLQAAIDLGGIAKGWTADHIGNRLSAIGRCVVNVCGDVATRGYPGACEGWEITFGEYSYAACNKKLKVPATIGIATSGITKRAWQVDGLTAHHIIDPRTGAPARTDVQTVTIFHRSTTFADCCATVVVILGVEAGLSWLAKQTGTVGAVTTSNGEWLTSKDFHTIAQIC